MNALEEDLDIRDEWLEIRQLKTEYQPNFLQEDQKKEHTYRKHRERTKTADNVSKEQWGLKRKQHEETENETTKETEETEQHKRRNVDKCNNTENE